MLKFKNPISPSNAPDPFMTYDSVTGYYYALFTIGKRLELFRSRHASTVVTDNDSRVIYTMDPENDGIYGCIWAPEMHRGSNGNWYIYTSGSITADHSQKRLFIMEGPSDDPFVGEWRFKGFPMPDVFSIDPSVYTAPDGKQYLCSSRLDDVVGQTIDITELINPYTVGERTATLAKAELDWELIPPYVNNYAIVEGGFFLERNGRLYIIYSANGCWSKDYCLGVLEYMGGEICDASSWKKHDKPIFTYGNGVFGPGHASFFYSPDGSEVWCAYHGLMDENESCNPAKRYFNIQKIDFDETGYPVMGNPIGYETDISAPSGEKD